MHTTPQDGINDCACHTLRVGHYDASEADVYKFLLGLMSLVDELDQVRRWLPFLGPDVSVIQEPVP